MTQNLRPARKAALPEVHAGPELHLVRLEWQDGLSMMFSALGRMWSLQIFLTVLLMVGAAAAGGAIQAVLLQSIKGVVAVAAGQLLSTGLLCAALLPLLRVTARQEDCPWRMSADEQPTIGTALLRAVSTVAVGTVAMVIVFIVLGAVAVVLMPASILTGSTTSAIVGMASVLLIVTLLQTVMTVVAGASIVRNAVEQRSFVSSMQEWFRLAHVKNAAVVSIASTLFGLAVMAGAFLLLKTLFSLASASGPGFFDALSAVGVLATTLASNVLLAVTFAVGSLLIAMYAIGLSLEYFDRALVRIDHEDLIVETGGADRPASNVSPSRAISAGGSGEHVAHAPFHPANDVETRAVTGSTAAGAVRQTNWPPLNLAADATPAVRAAECWKAHRQLRRIDDSDARSTMLANAAAHLEAVVMHRTPDEALLVHDDCVKADAAFEAGADARLGLARLALGTRQAELALRLVHGFDKRFPDHAQIPLAYSLAHEGLTATGKTDSAERVLAEMVKRYPKHEMTLRLQQLADAPG